MAAVKPLIFKPAVRAQVTLIVGLIAPSGAGKTYSAMRMASGIVGPGNRFAVIDTEAGRASHYADQFDFDVLELTPPFRPEVYADAIHAADAAGYGAIVVDSMSHEWAGEGGVVDWQEEELDRMAGDDWKKRENCKMAAWIKPKIAHKKMLQRILQCRANMILCFRAEEKTKPMKNAQGKIEMVELGWQPICSKEMPYELTASFLMTPDRPGMPQPIKLQQQHRDMFPLDRLIDETSGRAISDWAKGAPDDLLDEAIRRMRAAQTQEALDAAFKAGNFAPNTARRAKAGKVYQDEKRRIEQPQPADHAEFFAAMESEAAKEEGGQ